MRDRSPSCGWPIPPSRAIRISPGKTVGVQIGTTGAIAVQKIAGAKLKEYDSPDLALLDMLNKNIDAVVVDTPVAADFALNSPQFKGKLKIVGQPFTDESYGADGKEGRSEEAAAAVQRRSQERQDQRRIRQDLRQVDWRRGQVARYPLRPCSLTAPERVLPRRIFSVSLHPEESICNPRVRSAGWRCW